MDTASGVLPPTAEESKRLRDTSLSYQLLAAAQNDPEAVRWVQARRDYFRAKGIPQMMESIMQELLTVQPPCPELFIQRRLQEISNRSAPRKHHQEEVSPQTTSTIQHELHQTALHLKLSLNILEDELSRRELIALPEVQLPVDGPNVTHVEEGGGQEGQQERHPSTTATTDRRSSDPVPGVVIPTPDDKSSKLPIVINVEVRHPQKPTTPYDDATTESPPFKRGQSQPRPIITLDDVKKHNRAEDCWVVVNKRVYNVTSFVPLHPGGALKIKQNAGSDATSIFQMEHNVTNAIKVLEKYFVAVLE